MTILIFISSWAVAIRANAQQESVMQKETEQELFKVEREWAKAFIDNDVPTIERYVADDWVIINPEGMLIEKSMFLGIIKSGALTHEAMQLDNARVRIYGDTAVVTGEATSKGKYNGQSFSTRERSTDVFVKQSGQWKCVLTQLTALAQK
jgi:ketosteroid isomerase-like protein